LQHGKFGNRGTTIFSMELDHPFKTGNATSNKKQLSKLIDFSPPKETFFGPHILVQIALVFCSLFYLVFSVFCPFRASGSVSFWFFNTLFASTPGASSVVIFQKKLIQFIKTHEK
jgi:hypothetical protein